MRHGWRRVSWASRLFYGACRLLRHLSYCSSFRIARNKFGIPRLLVLRHPTQYDVLMNALLLFPGTRIIMCLRCSVYLCRVVKHVSAIKYPCVRMNGVYHVM